MSLHDQGRARPSTSEEAVPVCRTDLLMRWVEVQTTAVLSVEDSVADNYQWEGVD